MSAKKAEGMKYIGGGAFVPGLPMRDVTAAEVAHYGAVLLTGTGLYRPYQTGEEPEAALPVELPDEDGPSLSKSG